MKVLSREDILDILYGGAILGTGGGGSLTKGLACIYIAISKGKTFISTVSQSLLMTAKSIETR